MQWMKKTGWICHGGNARSGHSISCIECLKGQFLCNGLNIPGNKLLVGVCCTKGDELVGKWRKLHNEDTNSVYSSPTTALIISARFRWIAYRILVGNLLENNEMYLHNVVVRI
jgi:hypothetical protein